MITAHPTKGLMFASVLATLTTGHRSRFRSPKGFAKKSSARKFERSSGESFHSKRSARGPRVVASYLPIYPQFPANFAAPAARFALRKKVVITTEVAAVAFSANREATVN